MNFFNQTKNKEVVKAHSGLDSYASSSKYAVC